MSRRLRHLVRERAEGRCEYCRFHEQHLPFWPFHLDHIVARQHGGKSVPSNLAWCCPHCNGLKGANLTGVDPDSDKIVRLFHPRKDVWDDHFTLQQERIVGITASGRATVWLLQMNSRRRLALRLALMEDRLW